MMTTDYFPSFIAASYVGEYPFYGSIAKAIQSFFVVREKQDSRAKTVRCYQENIDCYYYYKACAAKRKSAKYSS